MAERSLTQMAAELAAAVYAVADYLDNGALKDRADALIRKCDPWVQLSDLAAAFAARRGS